MNSETRRKFLTAEWKHLAMLNHEIDPAILEQFVPSGTEFDMWNGKHLISVVGFMFLKRRILEIPIPFQQNFAEVNLRFYVWCKAGDGWRRGGAFIKEIAVVARKVYNEPYVALPMGHQIEMNTGEVKSAAYAWRSDGSEDKLNLTTRGEAQL